MRRIVLRGKAWTPRTGRTRATRVGPAVDWYSLDAASHAPWACPLTSSARGHSSPTLKLGELVNATATSAKPVKDPQPSVDRIDDLAKRILTGDIYLPKFQREFVWDRAQVLDLLDSVARNFPIGSILLWQSKQELRSESKIADLEIALPKPPVPI